MVKAFLYPKPDQVPKVLANIQRPIILQAFCPPPFRDFQDQEKLNVVCPVRVLDTYVLKAALWSQTDQLFVCFGSPKRGLTASKQIVSNCNRSSLGNKMLRRPAILPSSL